LANAYMTNLVKCGLNNDKDQFRGIGSYNEQCVRTCFTRFLSPEIEALKPLVVFAVGSTVENWLLKLLDNGYRVRQLPHPAGRRRGFRDEHYKVLYFWLVLRALYDAEIIGVVEAQEQAKRFLQDFERPS
jgi:uracil-DNA glycosylase